VSDRISSRDGRVIAMGNVRYDKAKFAVDSNAATDRFTHGEDDQVTYSVGANVKVLGDAFVLFGNHSTSLRANPTATRLYEEGAPRQIYSAFLSYNWRRNRLSHTVRVNGNNVLDKFYVGPDLNLGMGRQINFTYTVSFR
jgi:outer membrane receptor protein involved in Fe transport